MQQINEVRAREVTQLKKYSYTLAGFMFFLYVQTHQPQTTQLAWMMTNHTLRQVVAVDTHFRGDVQRLHSTGQRIIGRPDLPLPYGLHNPLVGRFAGTVHKNCFSFFEKLIFFFLHLVSSQT
jgi:hypothetical protein